MDNFVGYWSTVLDSIEAGLDGDTDLCRMYAQLLAARLRDHGDIGHAERILRIVEGQKGRAIRPMQEENDDLH